MQSLPLRMFLLFLLVVVILLIAPSFGSTSIPIFQTWKEWFFGSGESTESLILFSTRLPRIAFAFVAGAGLAVAGCVYQGVLRNDLAEPYSLGVAGGAAFGALCALHLAGGVMGISVPVGAFVGSLLSVGCILGLARLRSAQPTPATLLLAGVSLNFLFGGGIMLVQYLNDPFQSVLLMRWLMGGLYVYDWTVVMTSGAILLGTLVICLILSRSLDVLSLGTQTAFHLGVSVMRTQILLLGAVSLLVAFLVSQSGPVGFVGLVVPHALRRLISPRHVFLIPACAVGGGGFLVLCDTIARTVLSPTELPVGILTAFIGVPFFLLILVRSRNL